MKRLMIILAVLMLMAACLVGCERVESTANGDTPKPQLSFSEFIR